jgi:hypothetical protein
VVIGIPILVLVEFTNGTTNQFPFGEFKPGWHLGYLRQLFPFRVESNNNGYKKSREQIYFAPCVFKENFGLFFNQFYCC